MTDSVIGALRVVLGADTAALDSGLKDSRDNIASFGAGVGIAMAAAAASVAAAAFSIVASIKSTIASADHMNSLSQAAGVTVEELSKLNYAAGLSDISTDALSASLSKLTKSMSSAAQDGAGPASKAFEALGISVKNQDGTLKSSSQMFSEIADKFAGYRDGASKTALAIAIFGDAGAKLIPLLNQGSAGLQAAGDEAEKFGLVLDKKTTLAAAAFNENLKKADAVTQGLVTTVAAQLLPTLEMLSEQWLEFSKDTSTTITAINAFAQAINWVVTEAKIAYVEIGALGTQFGNLFTALKNMLSLSTSVADGQKIWSDYMAAAEQYGKQIDAVVAKIRETGTATEASAVNSAAWLTESQAVKSLNREVIAYGDAWKANAPVIAGAQSSALQSFLDSQNKRAAAMAADAATTSKNADVQARLRVEYEAQAISLAKNIPINEALSIAIAQTANAAGDAALKLQGSQLVAANQDPWIAYQTQMMNTETAMLAVGATADQIARAQAKVADQFGQSWSAIGANIASVGGSLSQLTGTWAKNNTAMGIASKAFGIGQAIINAQIGATKAIALYGPTPAGFIAAAAAIAQGAASIATISAQKFATGGLVTGPGSGMSDSIPAMLSNGEFVMNAEATQRNRSQLEAMNSGSSGAGGVTHISVTMSDPAYSREGLRVWIERINEMTSDGYRLNFT